MSVVRVGELGAADPQDHRAVTFDQGREGELGDLAGAGRKSLQKLAVGQLADRPDVEERVELP